jgi:hypothetical protein
MVGLLGQNLSIEGFGLRKPPGLVVCDGGSQCVLDSGSCHAGQYPAHAALSQGGSFD